MPDLNAVSGSQSATVQPSGSQWKQKVTPGEAQATFSKQLKEAIEGVNDAQVASNDKTKALARGEINDLHDVMITSQKASITMQTAVEMQGKVVEAYKEVMRMQV
ncbi:flagellar hook-basal body complex protein FliE [Halobacillus litoralis]|uniref:Flagellar hook-basal body complex protein FliE n=1 Tax=Halobacillus litoralis TaxID=45668 RepID=A0A410M8H3_9BACI|nr:flagellar hook-basal body complex protein FliE [Halobacillus litoralis]QAS51002.1 flagellar hook-basal body complex protein FliE [Halobacillus litoralis]